MARNRLGEIANEMSALEDACTALMRAYKAAHPDLPDVAVAYDGFGMGVLAMSKALETLGVPSAIPFQ